MHFFFATLTEDESFEELKNDMYALTLEKQKCVISDEQPYSGEILKEVPKENLISPSSFGFLKDNKAFNKTVDAMVSG